jgi:hypothetical protein
MPLEIPEEYRAAIGKIVGLPEEGVAQLISAISSVKIRSSASEMTDAIRGQVTSINGDDLKDIVEALYSLYHVREFSEVRLERFISDIVASVLKDEDLGASKEDVPRLRKIFRRLLNIDTLNALTKAIKLQRDGERIYCDSRIITDIRPIFGGEVSEAPSSAVIRHTFKIGYHRDGDGPHQAFYVAMDEADLHSLFAVIGRAIEKSETLTKVLKDGQIARLGI